MKRVLIVCRYAKNFITHVTPFVEEQGKELVKQGVEVDYFLIKGGPLSYLSNVKSLKKKINAFRPDLVHAHYGLSGVTAALQNLVPVVMTFHNGETLTRWVNFLSSLLSLRAKYVIYVAQHIYDKVYFKKKDKYTIMPCGVILDEIEFVEYHRARELLNLDEDKKYILFGGAFANLRKNYPLLKESLQYCKYKNIEVLEMRGLNRKQVSMLMCACDVFCLPSKSEGSPQALKEAMSCNTPIVATDIADIKHLMGGLDGHYLCEFDAENLAQQINKAISYRKDKVYTQGRERIIALGLDNKQVVTKTIAIYNDIVK